MKQGRDDGIAAFPAFNAGRKEISMRLLVPIIAVMALGLSPAHADERAAADYSADKGGVSFLVMRDGKLGHEDYSNGGSASEARELASGTKSFSGVIAAVAVKDGILTLDEKASDTLIEWRTDPTKAGVTIRQILNLTSGIKGTGVGRPPEYADAIAQPIVTMPGSAFQYDPVNFQIFGEIMRRKLKAYEKGRWPDALAYLQARIFDPLDIEPAQWNRGRDGMPRLPSGADLTARDWARFGEFVRLGGRWNGVLLVDPEAFAEMLEGSEVNAAYGLGWWLNKTPRPETLAASRTMRQASDLFTHPRRGELPGDLFMAAGAGNQRLYIIPSMRLVVVRQTGRILEGRRGRQFSDVDFLLALLR
jgi:CubicO group peptidase (beta-lactamase class C family)